MLPRLHLCRECDDCRLLLEKVETHLVGSVAPVIYSSRLLASIGSYVNVLMAAVDLNVFHEDNCED